MKKKIVGFTCGTFDLFHAGHVAMLKEAKTQCDFLIVGLVSDPTISHPITKNKPIQTLFERWLQVSSCKYVDQIIPINTEEEIIQIILTLQPDIRIVGEEYRDVDFLGKELCEIYYNSRKHSFSSTELRKRK
jgi:glycerol-3-phosphate cytidylyltransferase